MTLDTIMEEMAKGNMYPNRAADLLIIVSSKYGRACDEYTKKNAEYALKFTSERENHKSDTATERFLDHTELGIEKHYWKYQMKKAEMAAKALNSLIYQKTAEAKNEQ